MKRCPRKCAGIIKSVEQTGPISPRGPVQRNTEKAAASGAQAVGGSVPLRGTVAARAEWAPARPKRKGGPNRQNRGPPRVSAGMPLAVWAGLCQRARPCTAPQRAGAAH